MVLSNHLTGESAPVCLLPLTFLVVNVAELGNYVRVAQVNRHSRLFKNEDTVHLCCGRTVSGNGQGNNQAACFGLNGVELLQ